MMTSILLLIVSGLLMYLDVGEILKNTYTSQVSYFTIPVNITGFAGLLMIGTILRHYKLFDIEAHSKCFTYVLFALCLLCTVVQYALYDNQYALQYGKWGQYGIWSIPITTITGFTLTYSLICISYFLKRNEIIKRCLSFLGANSLDILMLHFGIAELICMIGGFWYPIYDISVYPADDFAWWHFFIVVFFTSVSIGVYFTIKKYSKNRLTQ